MFICVQLAEVRLTKQNSNQLSKMKKLTVILPDNTTHTRKTARVYTHAIAVQEKNDVWGCVSFCGNLMLAQKEAAKQIANGWWKAVTIVPVAGI